MGIPALDYSLCNHAQSLEMQQAAREPVRDDGIEDAEWSEVIDVPLLGPPPENV